MMAVSAKPLLKLILTPKIAECIMFHDKYWYSLYFTSLSGSLNAGRCSSPISEAFTWGDLIGNDYPALIWFWKVFNLNYKWVLIAIELRQTILYYFLVTSGNVDVQDILDLQFKGPYLSLQSSILEEAMHMKCGWYVGFKNKTNTPPQKKTKKTTELY